MLGNTYNHVHNGMSEKEKGKWCHSWVWTKMNTPFFILNTQKGSWKVVKIGQSLWCEDVWPLIRATSSVLSDWCWAGESSLTCCHSLWESNPWIGTPVWENGQETGYRPPVQLMFFRTFQYIMTWMTENLHQQKGSYVKLPYINNTALTLLDCSVRWVKDWKD